jgi:hypothetical protein
MKPIVKLAVGAVIQGSLLSARHVGRAGGHHEAVSIVMGPRAIRSGKGDAAQHPDFCGAHKAIK